MSYLVDIGSNGGTILVGPQGLGVWDPRGGIDSPTTLSKMEHILKKYQLTNTDKHCELAYSAFSLFPNKTKWVKSTRIF